MIKLAICMVITLCAFLFGNEFYKMQRNCLKALKELKEIVGDIIASVSFLSLDVYDICNRVFANRRYLDCAAFISISSGDFPLLWENACNASLNSISDDDKTLFLEIGTVLGSSDSRSQIKKLEYIEKSLDNSYNEKLLQLESKKKLYYTISIACGLLICLVIA